MACLVRKRAMVQTILGVYETRRLEMAVVDFGASLVADGFALLVAFL